MSDRKNQLLGEMLMHRDLITVEQLDKALNEQAGTKEFLGTILIRIGAIAEEELMPVLSEQLGIEYVRLKEMNISQDIINLVPAKFVSHYKLVPIRFSDGVITVAVTNPLDIHTIDDLRLILGFEVRAVLSGEREIQETIHRYYGVGADTIEQMSLRDQVVDVKVESEDIEALAEDASIIKFVNQVLTQAYHDRATDVHIEPFEDELQVRYRIDGILHDIPVPSTLKHFQAAVISRIKIMSNLNIAERRLPQDGRSKVRIGSDEVDLRISVLPTPYGESVVIRVLSTKILYSLENLGIMPRDLEIIEKIIKAPHGIIFVTGPTGSGKTTTLYACLQKINDKDKKILTIEDPIEYQLKGITQIQIHPKIGLTFAQGLRSMLRHDPDIMMVGEVRDTETAEITIRLALTGHLVFSTLHTNDAPGAVARLLDMGIEPYLVSSSVICIIAQRLVRILCPECKKEMTLTKEILTEAGITDHSNEGKRIFEEHGCQTCKFTGFRGRTAIYEMLLLKDPIKELILKRSSSDQIRRKALSLNMQTLRESGFEKVVQGVTSVSEILRITQEEEI